MSSLAVALPLTTDSIDGFVMIRSLKVLIKQNLKMLILTNPVKGLWNQILVSE